MVVVVEVEVLVLLVAVVGINRKKYIHDFILTPVVFSVIFFFPLVVHCAIISQFIWKTW